MKLVYVIMGVSGSGKTTIGEALAKVLGIPFYDGDDFHPPENVAKMSKGIPLNDADRQPWLLRLHDLITEHLMADKGAVLACSALKQAYRDLLRRGHDHVTFVHLSGDFDIIWERMSARHDHYMKADMLRSQFETLEPPSSDEAIIIHIEKSVDAIVSLIIKSFSE